MKLAPTITPDCKKKPRSIRIAGGRGIEIAGGWGIMGEGDERRAWWETASVVNSRTWDRFSPHNGDFFEGYRWLRFGRRARAVARQPSAAVDVKPSGSAAAAADPYGSADV
jgi:hypothetical protein